MTERPLKKLNIKKLDHLAIQLGLPLPELLKICKNISKYYRSGDRVINGKTRHIDEPVSDLRIIINRLQKILRRIQVPDYLHGGRRSHSIKTNAKIHLGKAAVLNFDIQDFFPSIHYPRVYELFINLDCSPDTARVLTRLTTYGGCVPHGSPTSTTIANLCIIPLARRIKKLAYKHQSDFTQFIDDGAISGPAYIEKIRKLIDKIIQQEGFTSSPKPHKRQTRYWYQEQIVTGVKVNWIIDVPKEKITSTHNCLRMAKNRLSKGISLSEKEINSLRGKVQHIHSLNSKIGGGLYSYFNKNILNKIH